MVARVAVVLAAAALVTLAGCASAGRVPAGEDEASRTRAALAELQLATEAVRQVASGLARDLGDVRREVQAARDEVTAVRREGEARQREAELRERSARAEFAERLGASERRFGELAGTLTGLETTILGLADQVARLESTGPTIADLARSRPVSQSPSPAPLSAEEMFDRGLDHFRSGELGQAILDLEEFAGRHPGHALVPNARFWIGEAYFRAREYQHAAVEYQKAVEAAPAGEKTAAALLKLGLSQRALKRDDRAREAWSQLIREFPESEAAQRARRELVRLPRGGG